MLGKFIYCGLMLFISFEVMATPFEKLLNDLDEHNLVDASLKEADSIEAMSDKEGSWGDPTLNVAAVNFPRESLSRDESMMTGIRFGISQSINISGKYGKVKESLMEMASSKKASGLQLKRSLAKELWDLATEKNRISQMVKIFEENLKWTKDNLKVSKRLYATGKVPQQAVLDIQMRRSQLVSDLSNLRSTLKVIDQEIASLIGSTESISLKVESVPWNHLEKWRNAKDSFDFREKELKHQVQASDLQVSAKNRNFVPDIKVGLNYTKRNDMDGLGDFVGASITIPIPTSSKRYADKSEALAKKIAAERRFKHYQNSKPVLLRKLSLEIDDQENQLKILKRETLKYAKSSRDVTARSYARGGADYLELLRSELQYQDQRVKKINLETILKKKKISYLFLKGDDLGLGSIK